MSRPTTKVCTHCGQLRVGDECGGKGEGICDGLACELDKGKVTAAESLQAIAEGIDGTETEQRILGTAYALRLALEYAEDALTEGFDNCGGEAERANNFYAQPLDIVRAALKLVGG